MAGSVLGTEHGGIALGESRDEQPEESTLQSIAENIGKEHPKRRENHPPHHGLHVPEHVGAINPGLREHGKRLVDQSLVLFGEEEIGGESRISPHEHPGEKRHAQNIQQALAVAVTQLLRSVEPDPTPGEDHQQSDEDDEMQQTEPLERANKVQRNETDFGQTEKSTVKGGIAPKRIFHVEYLNLHKCTTATRPCPRAGFRARRPRGRRP